MAVVLRLARHGQRNRPFYRIVASEHSNRRDGKFIEVVGYLNTMSEPAIVRLHEDKIRRWIGNGAKVSQVVRSLLVKNMPGLVEAREKHQREKILDARRKRKARLSSKGKSAKK